MLSFQRLDVYLCAIELMALCEPLLDGLPRRHAALSAHLRRAAMSIPLNIAEAQGRTVMQTKPGRTRSRADQRWSAGRSSMYVERSG
jgi:hypothetical protein